MTSGDTESERSLLRGLSETAEADLYQLLDEYERRNVVQLTELQRALESATHFALRPIAEARAEFLSNWGKLLESRLNKLDKLSAPPAVELVAEATETLQEISGSLHQLAAIAETVRKDADESREEVKAKLKAEVELGKIRTARYEEYQRKQNEFLQKRWR